MDNEEHHFLIAFLFQTTVFICMFNMNICFNNYFISPIILVAQNKSVHLSVLNSIFAAHSWPQQFSGNITQTGNRVHLLVTTFSGRSIHILTAEQCSEDKIKINSKVTVWLSDVYFTYSSLKYLFKSQQEIQIYFTQNKTGDYKLV